MNADAITRCAVAIVGRPNVGKSAIFNRLAGRRIAIVHAERGVTRDRLIEEVQWGPRRFELIDTGGLGRLDAVPSDAPSSLDTIEHAVRQQVKAAINDAAVILFVADLNAGLLPQDEDAAGFLRKSRRVIFLAANKADHPAHDALSADFTRLGFPVFPVSALHNRGFDALMQAVVEALPEGENRTVTHPLKITFVGRPNVGKSSVVNRLLRSDRVIVSDQPGTTRDSIDIPFVIGRDAMARHYLLTDTAGIRRAGKIRQPVEGLSRVRAERSIARADVVGLVLDAAPGPTAHDKSIAAGIIAARKGCVLIVNKWDLMQRVSEARYQSALREALPFCNFMPVVFVSAKTGRNIRRLVDAMDRVAAHLQAALPTGVLNRVIIDAFERVQPPLVGGKRLKIFYATQVQSFPVVVMLFVNNPRRMVPAYHGYLIRRLRLAFGLEGVPVILQLRMRRPPAGR